MVNIVSTTVIGTAEQKREREDSCNSSVQLRDGLLTRSNLGAGRAEHKLLEINEREHPEQGGGRGEESQMRDS